MCWFGRSICSMWWSRFSSPSTIPPPLSTQPSSLAFLPPTSSPSPSPLPHLLYPLSPLSKFQPSWWEKEKRRRKWRCGWLVDWLIKVCCWIGVYRISPPPLRPIPPSYHPTYQWHSLWWCNPYFDVIWLIFGDCNPYLLFGWYLVIVIHILMLIWLIFGGSGRGGGEEWIRSWVGDEKYESPSQIQVGMNQSMNQWMNDFQTNPSFH